MSAFDIHGQYDNLKSAVTDSIKEILKVETDKYKLHLNGVHVDDSASPSDYKSQKDAKLKGQTWSVPVYASLSITDKDTGKVVSKADNIRVMNLPKITDRGSFIIGGNEYQVMNQLRLRPGVYMAATKAGDVKAQINLAKGGVGKNLGIELDEDKLVLTARQANIPLYDLLRGLGMSHSSLKEHWGAKATDVQAEKYDPAMGAKAVQRFQQAFTSGENALTFMTRRTAIDPVSTRATVGKSFDQLEPELLARTAGKLIRVKDGQEPMVDRDSIFNKSLHGVEDFVKERLTKRQLSVKTKLQRKIDRTPDVSRLVTPGVFAPLVEKFFSDSDKAMNVEQTNPLTMLSDMEKVTILGEGGLSGESHQVTAEMREVHPTHLGFLDPIKTPESGVGSTLHLPMMTRKVGDTLTTPVINLKTGKRETLTPAQLFEAVVAFPDQFKEVAGNTFGGGPIASSIKATYRGEMGSFPANKVQYRLIAPQQMFSISVNMIPFLASNQGNRAMMASKHMTQAIPLKEREAPLVQVRGGPNVNTTFEKTVGGQFSTQSPVDGVVTKIDKDYVYVKSGRTTEKVPLYNNFHLNQNTFMHSTPTVAVGDRVTKGQLLADSNYTKGGTLALGTHLRTAFIPFKGYNFEDGIVITDSAAKKLTSEHIHKEGIHIDDSMVLNPAKFRSEFPNEFPPAAYANLDGEGIVKKGTKLRYGDPIFAGLRLAQTSVGAQIHKALTRRYNPVVEKWTQEDEGTVLDVKRVGKDVTVYIKTEEVAKIGDKLALRHGNKGVITHILPDSQAPQNAAGEHVEVMLNPHGVIGRINVGQIYESSAAKAAAKTGKPYVVENFTKDSHLDDVNTLLHKAGISDKELLKDPTTNKVIGNVHVGSPYILKLYKQSHKAYSARGYGPGSAYTGEMQPGGSGEEGSKSLDPLTLYSMLAHGSRENLREMAAVKGERNDEYWEALKSGQRLPAPKTPFVFNKFLDYMKAAGVDVQKRGNELALVPMTDKETAHISKLSITEPAFVQGKNLKEIKGGFVDSAHLGGLRGTHWGHIDLKEPVVNPVFEKPIKALTGLKGADYDAIVTGQKTVDVNGEKLTGGVAVKAMLSKLDIDKELAAAEAALKKAKKSNLDELNRRYRYLKVLKENNIRPEEAYVNSKIPVLPPTMRPVNTLPDGSLALAQANYLYQGVGILNKVQGNPVMKMLSDENKAAIRKDMYDFNKALRGLDSANILNKEVTGMIGEIAGGQPKTGLFQNKILKKQQDLVGRGVILPEPSMGVDEVGLPKDMLWKLYEPFVTKTLVRNGMTLREARKEVDARTFQAQRALDAEMQYRPVMLNRAPSLHKFSIMGFKPKAVEGKSIKIPSLVVGGFNADFDGDTMTVHVPISDKAVQEAHEMLPSKHLYKPGTGELMLMPANESMLGIYMLSSTAAGRTALNQALPLKYHVSSTLNKKAAKQLFDSMSKELPAQEFASILNKVKRMGEEAAYAGGATLGMDDISIPHNRDALVKKVVHAFEAKDPQAVKKATDALTEETVAHLGKKDSAFYHMIASGASSKSDQVRQIVAAPTYVTGYKGKTMPVPITKSYAEGLDTPSYWAAAFGARSGMIDRSIQTSDPGAFSKELMSSVVDVVVSTPDCGTHKGIDMSIDSPELYDRYTAGDQHGIRHNTAITPDVIKALRQHKAHTVHVRSPLTCEAPKGICRMCHGLDERGKLPGIGENVGAKAGQAIAEPMTQMVMRTFHTGGLAGTGMKKGGFERIKQLLEMPAFVAGEAPITMEPGVVTKITHGIAGLENIHVRNEGDKKDTIYHAPKGAKMKVAVGDRVDRGDVLSEGTIKPQKLLHTKGMMPALNYITDELKTAYADQKQNISRKTFETVLRPVGNLTKVTKASPHAEEWVPGDLVPFSSVQAFNNNLRTEVPVNDDAIGYIMDEAVGQRMPVGYTIESKEDIDYLKKSGKRTIKVRKQPVKHEPTLRGINTLPLLKRDWLAHMGYNHIKDAVTIGGSEGWKSNIHGYHPIPAFAHAAEFGLGEEGKY